MTALYSHPRLVRYAELQPCTDAFIDTRTPGSDAKENFTIIGPGVSENPNQHVHIAEAHGFNIGAARQPPGCTNSQHSHDTAEVFFVHSGKWAFRLGEHGKAGEVILEAGDIISLPTQVFRGFENIGETEGFLWAVLGGDDPGRVLWAPDVFDMAENYGLVLLENGNLIDTRKGEVIPHGIAPMARTDRTQVDALKILSKTDFASCVCRAGTCNPRLLGPTGCIGHLASFTIDWLELSAGDVHQEAAQEVADVLFLHRGEVEVSWTAPGHAPESVKLQAGDTLTIPKHAMRSFKASATSALVRVLGR